MTLPYAGRAATRENLIKIAGLLNIPKREKSNLDRFVTITFFTDELQEGTYKLGANGPRFKEVLGQLRTMGLSDVPKRHSIYRKHKFKYSHAHGDPRIEIEFDDRGTP